MIDGRPVTLTTGSMNRLAPLRRSLATWLALTEVDKIIIVDWGSKEPLNESLADFCDDDRVVVVRTEQKHWHNSKCHNLELQLVSDRSLWLRLDNDTLVRPDFFSKHLYQAGSFYAVNWRTVPAEVNDKRNLAGTLFLDPDDARKIQGYNERLVHYGHEDDDLHARLVLSGCRWLEVRLETVDHIPHSEKARYENLAVAEQLARMVASYKVNRGVQWRDKLNEARGASGELERSMLLAMSDRIVKTHPWSARDRMTTWSVVSVTVNYREAFECKT